MELFNQGATKLRIVGVHHFGLACDIVRVVGRRSLLERRFLLSRATRAQQRAHLGRRLGDPDVKHSFVDSGHVQRCTVARQGDFLAGTWFPNEAYNPYDDGQHLFVAATKAATIKAAATSSPKRPG